MKFYNFFPGFIIVTIAVVLLFLNEAFKLNLPVLRNIKNPFLVFVILGFMMCAFGTIGHSFSNIVVDGKVDLFVIGMIFAGALLLAVSGFALFSSKPLWGFLTKNTAFYIVAVLILLKIGLSTARILKLS